MLDRIFDLYPEGRFCLCRVLFYLKTHGNMFLKISRYRFHFWSMLSHYARVGLENRRYFVMVFFDFIFLYMFESVKEHVFIRRINTHFVRCLLLPNIVLILFNFSYISGSASLEDIESLVSKLIQKMSSGSDPSYAISGDRLKLISKFTLLVQRYRWVSTVLLRTLSHSPSPLRTAIYRQPKQFCKQKYDQTPSSSGANVL